MGRKDLEQKIRAYHEIRLQIEALEAQRKELGSQILADMEEKKVAVGAFTVRRFTRLAIKLSIEEARALDAVTLKEVIDRDKIKSLFDQGEQIEGVSEFQFIQVSSPKES